MKSIFTLRLTKLLVSNTKRSSTKNNVLHKRGNKMVTLCFVLCHVNKNRFVDFPLRESVLFTIHMENRRLLRGWFSNLYLQIIVNLNAFYNKRNLKKNPHRLELDYVTVAIKKFDLNVFKRRFVSNWNVNMHAKARAMYGIFLGDICKLNERKRNWSIGYRPIVARNSTDAFNRSIQWSMEIMVTV